jgi:hypothetical protein
VAQVVEAYAPSGHLDDEFGEVARERVWAPWLPVWPSADEVIVLICRAQTQFMFRLLPEVPQACSSCDAELSKESVICGKCGYPNIPIIRRRASIAKVDQRRCKHDFRFMKEGKICIKCACSYPLSEFGSRDERMRYAESLEESICLDCGAAAVEGNAYCDKCGEAYESFNEVSDYLDEHRTTTGPSALVANSNARGLAQDSSGPVSTKGTLYWFSRAGVLCGIIMLVLFFMTWTYWPKGPFTNGFKMMYIEEYNTAGIHFAGYWTLIFLLLVISVFVYAALTMRSINPILTAALLLSAGLEIWGMAYLISRAHHSLEGTEIGIATSVPYVVILITVLIAVIALLSTFPRLAEIEGTDKEQQGSGRMAEAAPTRERTQDVDEGQVGNQPN